MRVIYNVIMRKRIIQVVGGVWIGKGIAGAAGIGYDISDLFLF